MLCVTLPTGYGGVMYRFARLDPAVTWVPQPDGRCLLVHEPSQQQALVGALEHQLLVRLDGSTPLSELEHSLSMVTGRSVRPGTVERMAQSLAASGLVHIPVQPPLRWLPDERVRCDSSGVCCHLQVGPLEPLDVERMRSLPWEAVGEADPGDVLASLCEGDEPDPAAPDLLGMRRRADGACVLLASDQRCRAHALFGPMAKPALCRLFPLFSVDVGPEVRVGVSLRCRGACTAGPERPLADEVARLGDGLLRTGLSVGPLGVGVLPGATDVHHAQAAALEPELLESFRSAGRCASGALAGALRLVLRRFPWLPPGAAEPRWRSDLTALYQGHIAYASVEADKPRIEALVAVLERSDALQGDETLPALPVTAAVDSLLRRNLRGMLFTRYHLFRFGLVPGLALLARITLLARLDGARRALAAGASALTVEHLHPALTDALMAAYGLGEVERFPGLGARILTASAQALEAVAERTTLLPLPV